MDKRPECPYAKLVQSFMEGYGLDPADVVRALVCICEDEAAILIEDESLTAAHEMQRAANALRGVINTLEQW
jgi:prolyl-tRNA editing enzyme YbaK/EbsC (Cys-tRNA(Pro) deacylase)